MRKFSVSLPVSAMEAELLGVQTWLSTFKDCISLCLSDETLKAVGPFYLVSNLDCFKLFAQVSILPICGETGASCNKC